MSGFSRDGTITVAFTTLSLGLSLLAQVMVARALGPEGRGALSAVLTAPLVLGWLWGMGCSKSVTFFLSRNPALGATLFSTWLAIMLPIGAIAMTMGELVLPALLAAQSEETLTLARLYMPTLVLVLLMELALGLVLGDQAFLTYNILRFLQPAGAMAGYALLWFTGHFTVESAVVLQAVIGLIVVASATARVIKRHGLAWPDPDVAKHTFWYALRTHGDVISGTITQKLDLLIIPAFVAAANVGFYAVATNGSWIVVTISGALATIVLPAAARRGESGRSLVIKSLHGTLMIGAVLGAGLFLCADLAIRLIYGAEFSASVLPLRILLPGAVAYAGACVLINGLFAENRPFAATIAQALGMVVTIAGLLAFLRSGGIFAAAVVSTAAYVFVFVAAAVLYRRATGLSWSAFVPTTSDILEPLQLILVMCRLAPRRFAAAVGIPQRGGKGA